MGTSPGGSLRTRVAVCALAALLLDPAAAQYPVWSSISTIGSSATSMDVPPPGCSCIDGSSPCTKFDCTCTCNLAARQCDANCCCDPDCSAAEVARVTASAACLPQGPVNRSLRSCIDLDLARSLVYVNPRPRMAVEGAPLIDSVLCVTVDNSPISGTYLGAQGVVSAATLSAAGVARSASYLTPARTAPYAATSAAQMAGVYLPGDRVAAATNLTTSSTGALRAVSSGWWALPAAGPAGTCGSSPAAFAAFRAAVAPRQCARAPAPLSAASCEAMSATRLVTNLQLGATPLAAPAAPGGFVPVALGAVTVVNYATGATSAGTAAAAVSSFSNTTAGCACAGALTGVSYVIAYDGLLNVITSAVAHVTVTNVSLAPALCAGAASPAGLLSVPITVAVSWVDATSPSALAHQDARSGAPGYALGAPVLAGVLVAQSGASASSSLAATDKLAVVRGAPAGSRVAALAALDGGAGFRWAGLTLRGPGAGGACVASGGAPDAASVVPVRFGEDVSVSCAVALDFAAFSALCASGATTPYVGLWAVNASTTGGATAVATHVGTFGNADPWKYWQWTALSASAAAPAPALDAVRGVCSNVPAALNVEFLTAAVGEAGNPQWEIIAARTSYAADTWAFQREDVRDAAAAPQTFLLKTTVTWTQYPAAARSTYVAPVPPVVPNVPADLWYPFSAVST